MSGLIPVEDLFINRSESGTWQKDISDSKKEVPDTRERTVIIDDEIKALEKQIEKDIERFRDLRKNHCLPFFIDTIEFEVVDDIFDALRENYKDCDGKLDVIIDSSGGDIHAAYNLAMLFRKYGYKELSFFVPRWAKSAATLIVCSGDNLYMSPVAELGPLDPQINQFNPLERRLEDFSPLHLGATLELIRNEFKAGNKDLANGLLQRLQFPLTLGYIIKSKEVSQNYMCKLLGSRLLKNLTPNEIKSIADKFTESYPDHSYCITTSELNEIGIDVVKELESPELDIIWNIYKSHAKKQDLQYEKNLLENNKNPDGFRKTGSSGNGNKRRKHIRKWEIL